MASFAEMMAGNALESSSQAGSGMADSMMKGAELGLQIEQVQQKRQQVEMEKQKFQAAKLEKIGGWYETAAKMSEGSAKRAFTKDFITQGISALGMSDHIDPTSIKMLSADPVLGSYLKAQVRDGVITQAQLFEGLKDPSKLAKYLPDAKRFGDAQAIQQAVSENLGGIEEAGNVRGKYDLEMAKADAKAEAAMTMLKNRNEQSDKRLSQRDQVIHNQNVKEVGKDPNILKWQGQYVNLSNAVKNMENGIVPTKESFAELQQAVRANLGIKGQTTGVERHASYFKGLGFNMQDAMQFLTMEPQSIESYGGSQFLDHVKSLARSEQNNIRTNINKRASSLADAHRSFYSARPELKADYETFAYGQGDQVSDAPKPGAGKQPLTPEAKAALIKRLRAEGKVR